MAILTIVRVTAKQIDLSKFICDRMNVHIISTNVADVKSNAIQGYNN